MKEQVLKAMKEAGKPVSAGDVTKALGATARSYLTRSEVSHHSAYEICSSHSCVPYSVGA